MESNNLVKKIKNFGPKNKIFPKGKQIMANCETREIWNSKRYIQRYEFKYN